MTFMMNMIFRIDLSTTNIGIRGKSQFAKNQVKSGHWDLK
jgi:hypothetical protein